MRKAIYSLEEQSKTGESDVNPSYACLFVYSRSWEERTNMNAETYARRINNTFGQNHK